VREAEEPLKAEYTSPVQGWPALDVSPLVPVEYAAFRGLVADAVALFVERLPPARLTEIVAAQCALPPEACAEERLTALISRCPTLHKLGQVVARDRRLSATLRARLQALESMESATTVEAVMPSLRSELGASALSDLRIESRALAEASVAVVIPFTFEGSHRSHAASGVLKVLKPHIDERLEEELEIWVELADFIDERCQRDGLPAVRCREIFATVRHLLSREVRLDIEQANLHAAAEFYADSPRVQIPAVLPYSTRRITAMERVFGIKVTEAEHLSEAQRKDLAGVVLRELVAKPVWSASSWAIFHADPHAGNLMYTEDGRLAMLDWSLVGRLDKTEREQTAQIVLGALCLDPVRIRRAIAAMAMGKPDEAKLREVVNQAVGRLYRDELPGLDWLLSLLEDAMFKAGVRFGEELVLFRKSILTLEGVAADVSTGTSLGKVLPLSGGAQFLREWARRCVASPVSREFATHVSNLDLLSLYFAAPSAATRFVTDRLFWPRHNEGSAGPPPR
jgi:ubiquinone biosynthesis protein